MSNTTSGLDAEAPDALVLVGGLGTRLRERLGHATPKPLAPINGRPFLWYLLRDLAGQGVRRATLATSHLSETFQRDLERFAPPGLQVGFSFERSPRGTGGAVVEALPALASDPFFALNGDSIADVPLGEMLAFHRSRHAVATVALVRVEDCARFGTVLTDDEGAITGFLEKTGRSAPGWINAGMYVLSRRALAPVLDRETSSLERDVFPAWTGRGLLGYRVDSPFIDIGTPESYEAAGAFFAARGRGRGHA